MNKNVIFWSCIKKETMDQTVDLSTELNADLCCWVQHSDVYKNAFYYNLILDGSVCDPPPGVVTENVEQQNRHTLQTLRAAVARDLAVINFVLDRIQ